MQTLCVGVCKQHPTIGVCKGCFRLPLEIRKWHSFSEERQLQIKKDCEIRKLTYGDINA